MPQTFQFDHADRDLREQHDAAAAELTRIAGAERAAAWMADPRSFTRATSGLSRDGARMADYFLTVICNRRLEAAENREARRKQAAREVSREVQNMIDRAAADDARRAAARQPARLPIAAE